MQARYSPQTKRYIRVLAMMFSVVCEEIAWIVLSAALLLVLKFGNKCCCHVSGMRNIKMISTVS